AVRGSVICVTATAESKATVKPAAPAPRPVPVAAAPVTAAQPKGSQRFLWVAVGGLCAVGALVAVVQFGPWKKSEAGSMETAPPAVAAPSPSIPLPAQAEVTPAQPPA